METKKKELKSIVHLILQMVQESERCQVTSCFFFILMATIYNKRLITKN